jgi:hypothetical protein
MTLKPPQLGSSGLELADINDVYARGRPGLDQTLLTAEGALALSPLLHFATPWCLRLADIAARWIMTPRQHQPHVSRETSADAIRRGGGASRRRLKRRTAAQGTTEIGRRQLTLAQHHRCT